jgi:hypothetical protein
MINSLVSQLLLCALGANAFKASLVELSKAVRMPRQVAPFVFPSGHPLQDVHLDDTQIHPYDTLRLRFQGMNETFFVHLEPNVHLIHPDIHSAAVYANESQDAHLLSQTKAYHGTVLQPVDPQAGDLERLFYTADSFQGLFHSVGEAQLVLFGHSEYQKVSNPIWLEDEHHYSDLSFQGSVSMGDNEYHLKTLNNYHASKKAHYPTLSSPLSNAVVISMQHEQDFTPTSCQSTELRPKQQESLLNQFFVKRQDFSRRGRMQRANVAVAADCHYVKRYRGKQGALQQITSAVNKASSIYNKELQIKLSIVDSDIKDKCGGESWNEKGCASIENMLELYSNSVAATQTGKVAYSNLFTGCQ